MNCFDKQINRIISITSLFILAAGPTQVFADQSSGTGLQNWYVGLSYSVYGSSHGDTHIPSIASKPPLKSEPVYNHGMRLGANLGYRLNQYFRVEGEFASRSLPIHKVNNAIGQNTLIYVRSSHTDLWSLFANGYFDTGLRGGFSAYLGLGAGYVNVDNLIKPEPAIPVAPGFFFTKKQIEYHVLGYQGMLGVAYRLTPNIDLGVEYKYFATLEKKARGVTNLGADGYKTKQDMLDQAVALRLQYYLT